MYEPREFICFDDSPFNNGWGYNCDYEPAETEENEEQINEE
jgi:hypothetical protein